MPEQQGGGEGSTRPVAPATVAERVNTWTVGLPAVRAHWLPPSVTGLQPRQAEQQQNWAQGKFILEGCIHLLGLPEKSTEDWVA